MADANDSHNRRNLGRGLSALLGGENSDYESSNFQPISRMIPVEHLHPCSLQPRKHFDDEEFASLVASVRAQGVLQPILVRYHPKSDNKYEIIAGERRWRAAQQSQIHEMPAVIKDLSDSQALEIALVENLQRENLTPLDEAQAYRQLIDDFGRTQEETARTVGKSRSHIANMLRLISLPDAVKLMINEGKLSAGHGRALVNVEDPKFLADRIVKLGLNVRQTEAFVKKINKKDTFKQSKADKTVDPNVSALERSLTELLGLRVAIAVRGDGGALTVQYDTLEQLDDLLCRLSNGGRSD